MTVFAVAMYWLLRRAFARDEQMVALLFRNRHYLHLVFDARSSIGFIAD